jgi:hypothetical protein
MATPWIDSIKNSKQLTVFPGPNVTGDSVWSKVFTDAMAVFNQLSASLKLGVTLIDARSTTPPTGPPDQKKWPDGANVQFEVGTGTVDFTAQGDTVSCTVLSGPGVIQAMTQPMRYQLGSGANIVLRIKRAFILVPIHPQVLATLIPPVPGQSGRNRDAGPPIKLVLAVHELIHACGLDNSDHLTGGNGDVFFYPPQFDAGTFDKPQDDRIEVGGNRKLPPIFISAETQSKIQAIWK